jgi:hypothetical protein
MLSYCPEHLFDDLAEERILLVSQCRGDLRPVVGLQSFDGCRKEKALFHGHVVTLVYDEVANSAVDDLPWDFPIRQYALDCLRDAAQTLGTAAVLGREIANTDGGRRIAHFQLLEDQVLLRVVVGIGIDFEIRDNCPDNLVVRPLSPSKEAQLPLENEKQLLDVPMFLA